MKRPITVTGAIIEKDGKVLLTKRTIEPFKGYWCLPGGHIEAGETAEDAIVREIKEEIGVDFKPEFFCYFDAIIGEIDGHVVSLWFTGNINGKIKINKEVSEARWFPIKEAMNMKLAFRNNKILERFVKK